MYIKNYKTLTDKSNLKIMKTLILNRKFKSTRKKLTNKWKKKIG